MAKRLKALREAAGLSQTQLAREADVPVGSIRAWEQSKRTMLVDAAIKLAGALGVSMDVFCGLAEAPAGKKGRGGK